MSLLENATIDCPYCGEPIEIEVDCSVPRQRYVEDCSVCCRPIEIEVAVDDTGSPSVTARHENE
ncbi:MAG: CPXCG motif-containing cysteine-rich protein [Gammaproteobacteria bacterium]|nr:CPXCG motif-containing cysteine-rich protein [Gammaproteobacteria bacterium]